MGEFSQGKDVYLTNNAKVADLLAKIHSNIDQDEALLLMWAALILCKRCLQKQESFNGSFAPNGLTSPDQKSSVFSSISSSKVQFHENKAMLKCMNRYIANL